MAVIGLVSLLGWKFVFGKAIYEVIDNSTLSNRILHLENVNNEIANFERQISQYDAAVLDEEVFVDNIANFCGREGLSIISFPSGVEYEQNGLKVNQYTISVKGAISSMVRLAYFIEVVKKMGRVIHFGLSKEENRDTGEVELVGVLVVSC